jgi:predicted nucleotidyltransferase component of viral defense system
MNEAVEQMLARYQPVSQEDHQRAIREILQELMLLGLYRADFFEKAAFYGGTALRIFHGLNRFSEDLDFTLLAGDRDFRLDRYFSGLTRELSAFNFNITLERIEKPAQRLIESAFLKANTKLMFLRIRSARALSNRVQHNQVFKVKFEVDIAPATSFKTERKTLLLPAPFTVTVLTPADLFAGKMHAALLRKWRNRVKGRDFYDVHWFLSREIPIRSDYLEEKLRDSGALDGKLTKKLLVNLFRKRVEDVDWKQAKDDVSPFIRDKSQIKLWSAPFFAELIEKLELV